MAAYITELEFIAALKLKSKYLKHFSTDSRDHGLSQMTEGPIKVLGIAKYSTILSSMAIKYLFFSIKETKNWTNLLSCSTHLVCFTFKKSATWKMFFPMSTTFLNRLCNRLLLDISFTLSCVFQLSDITFRLNYLN